MAGGSNFTWAHALNLHCSLSPFDSPIPKTHQAFADVTPISYERLNVAGLLVTLYGLDELPPSPSSVTCLWLLHGRGDTQDSMSRVAAAFHQTWSVQRKSTDTHLICVTLDQRNHGSRMIDNLANVSWKQGNPTHAPDMFGLFSGTATDVSLLLTHLPSYLPVTIDKHLCCGVSLGGHATWQLLVSEPRIEAGIVVIGCPDYARLMRDRAVRNKLATTKDTDPPGEKFVGSRDFPPALVKAVRQWDPAGILLGELEGGALGADLSRVPEGREMERVRGALRERLGGKKVLCVSGGKDGLVPYAQGQPFLDWLKAAVKGEGGWAAELGIEVEDFVDGEAKHEFSGRMKEVAEKWLCGFMAGERERKVEQSRL